jgi:hypothetical protein
MLLLMRPYRWPWEGPIREARGGIDVEFVPQGSHVTVRLYKEGSTSALAGAPCVTQAQTRKKLRADLNKVVQEMLGRMKL